MLKDRSLEKRALLLIASYFLLQLIIRLLVSPGLERDEAEQLLLTQQIGLGYGSQPPLYTWLQAALFSLFGANIFSLALLKNLLLSCTYFCVYKSSRALGHTIPASVAAMLSLFFIPQIVWESQRDLTHSVIVTTLTAVTIFCWIRLKNNQSIANYVLIGLCCGLGLLGKYNFGIFLLSLLAASFTIAEYRAMLVRRRISIAVATMLAVIAPHVIWAATHLQLLLASSRKFKQAAQGGYLSSVIHGTGSLIVAALAFSAPLLLIYLYLRFRNRSHCRSDMPDKPASPSSPNLLLRSIFFSLAICMLMVLCFQVTAFKDRWMQPILFFLPIALLPAMESYLICRRGRQIQWIAGVTAGIVLLAFSFRVVAAPYTGSVTRFNMPYQELVSKMAEQVQAADLVLAQSSLLAGHLKLLYPAKRVTIPGGAWLYHDTSPKSVLVAWEDGATWKDDERLAALTTDLLGSRITELPFPTVQAGYRHLAGKTMSVSSTLLERAATADRRR